VLEKAGPFWYQVYPVYPMAGAIEGFRSCFMPDKPMPWQMMGISFIVAILIFISGAHYFKKTEKHFADLA
jgi:ABC-type polysaccharide/polyol phosphate export permease